MRNTKILEILAKIAFWGKKDRRLKKIASRSKWNFARASLLIGFLLIGVAWADEPIEDGYCAFCNPEVLKAQTFYEDELILALYTHKPIFPGHCLIIPKRHVVFFDQLSPEEMSQMFVVIKKVNEAVKPLFKTVSYLLLQKNGLEAGQSVPHVHFHYIPREAGDRSTVKFIARMFWANIQAPISAEEMAVHVQLLKEEFQQMGSH